MRCVRLHKSGAIRLGIPYESIVPSLASMFVRRNMSVQGILRSAGSIARTDCCYRPIYKSCHG